MGLRSLYRDSLLDVLPSNSLKMLNLSDLNAFIDRKAINIFLKVKQKEKELQKEYPVSPHMTDLEEQKHLYLIGQQARKKVLSEEAQELIN